MITVCLMLYTLAHVCRTGRQYENLDTFRHHCYHAIMKNLYPYLHPHACLVCRKSFKRKADGVLGPSGKPCPDCGAELILLYRHFKAPPKNDKVQWEKVRYLIEHGYYFGRIKECGSNWPKPPETLDEAREFIEKYVSKTNVPKPRLQIRSESSIREEKEKIARIRQHKKSTCLSS